MGYYNHGILLSRDSIIMGYIQKICRELKMDKAGGLIHGILFLKMYELNNADLKQENARCMTFYHGGMHAGL